MNKFTFFMLMALFAAIPTYAVKYVAVVETEVDAQSGVSAILNPAEVRQITAELQRQATKNLPREKYNVMTSETVMSMGGAILEECAEENCVISLGSKIGADYIVRGTISKFGTKITLSVELYETDNGTLVVSSELVHAENVVELFGLASRAAANMYWEFLGEQGNVGKQTFQPSTQSTSSNINVESGELKVKKYDWYFAPKYQFPMGTPVEWGGVNFEGGLIWGDGVFLGIDINFGYSYDDSGIYNDDFVNDEAIFLGGGLSLGDVYNFANQWQVVYGGSVGFWRSSKWEVVNIDNVGTWTWNFLAPFVKLRWNALEITYRWLCGYYDRYGYGGSNGSYHEYRGYGFDWKTHQLMIGLYFATSKRQSSHHN